MVTPIVILYYMNLNIVIPLPFIQRYIYKYETTDDLYISSVRFSIARRSRKGKKNHSEDDQIIESEVKVTANRFPESQKTKRQCRYKFQRPFYCRCVIGVVCC